MSSQKSSIRTGIVSHLWVGRGRSGDQRVGDMPKRLRVGLTWRGVTDRTSVRSVQETSFVR